MEIKPIQIIPMILLVAILAGGIYYWQKNKEAPNPQPVATKKSAATSQPLGASNDQSSSVLGESQNENQTITTGKEYIAKVNEIKKPINDAFTDLTDKMKYPNLFSSDDIIKIANETNAKITSEIEELNNLSIDKKFASANQSYIKSLEYLQESLASLKKSYDKTNKNAKKDREEFAYLIDQSNNELKDLQIPN